MYLFLASSLDKTLPLLRPLLKNKPATKVAFIANASDNAQEHPWWVDNDRIKFKELGYETTDIDLRTITAEELEQTLADADILHIAGGAVFYLVGLIRKRGLESTIVDTIKNDSIIYTGTSAGAMIMGPSLAMFAFDEEEKPFLADVPDQKGLGIINFSIMPHSNNPEFVNEFGKVVEKLPINTDPLLFIQDTQAVWLENNTFKIVSL
ncbi:MAG: Peptidase family S51 [Candidatus Wolfebacteria bacterium GW2011_GWE1_48_7]|uniref:Peptidase family S51 n=2 Tax=Candidatus Wolfeibacteriota TaxID=1752735 RepID=A0A0G1U7Q4_9BACT|nr:MAG: Peptidase E [Candidatus Wolfebacteria bacterium GW2011_GWB1_47_1]KKU37084.1 MAG: Peptidase family S51 [Candidatus Wolfebacteria bacterium GW2011_GWC2_46_275]KKU42382.1 MAG: Peptidase family S51 [Candidatus Wolfebacteria bacterium GW2011_GWB2_46_69]KKU54348.1 MAG: Peptidase family S51 [Candidatus Wolfebacteria bacterium GW2011_GWC1_47_103]KKU59527.1 MAG: Peptidase family S51 [Candidatus Wolfebacteria bacterium GW2011_GWE2_47_12]KKU66179.1 MAG: Peptidase family S51 [Candidatus Wolfebacte